MNEDNFKMAFIGVLGKWPRAYSQDQVNMIFRKVDHLDLNGMLRISKHILEHFRQAPLLTEIDGVLKTLGLAKKLSSVQGSSGGEYRPRENHHYWIKGKYWGDNTSIFYTEGPSVRDRRFFFKKDNPDHPAIALDNEFRDIRLREINKALNENRYNDLVESWKIQSMREQGIIEKTENKKTTSPGLKMFDPRDAV